MKKMEWLVAILIMAIGMICLIISATSFREISFLQMGGTTGKLCISMIAVTGTVGLIYYIKSRKQ
ncbi:hypothetical protein [Paenibacillus bouchesdurhonensis]|uniref:hypothetical protein n=1 Tax=Paenibacillus bouchesdurhonensis TaxID=1870990 RepID=UPI000DA6218C|nr:hypothetical protein [Paenibacillus bouchesdurhonensis]